MRLSVFVVAGLLVAASVAGQQNAFVVDSEGKAVAAVDLGSGKIVSKVELPFKPDRAAISPEGKTVVALFRGEGTTGFWVAEFRPKGKSQAAVLRDGKLIGATELGWGLAESAFSQDGRSAYVLTTGYESNKVAERKASELLRLDLTTGQVAERIPFDAAAEAFATDASGATGIVYSPPYPKKKPTPLPARLTFIDLASFKAGPTIEITGDVRKPVAVGDLLYVLDRGSKSANGKLSIVSMKNRAVVKTIELGPEAVMGGSDPDDRVYVLSQAADKKSGRVMVLKRADVVTEYRGPAAAKFVSISADRKRLYVAGWKEFSIIDLGADKAAPAVESARDPFAVLATRDGRRAFVVSMDGDQCCRITTFDAEAMKQMTSFLGGSKGERFGQALAAVALSVASYQAGRSAAQASGGGTFYYSIYTPTTRGAARGPLAFGPGEQKVYLVDTQTNDVTIVNVADGQRIKTLDAGSGLKEVVPMHDAGVVAGIADSELTLIDVNTDEVRSTVKLAGNVVDAVMSPDEQRLIVFGKERVVVLDANTAKEISRVDALKHPVQVIFAPRAR